MADIFGPQRLQTGIEPLDRELDGGIPPGSMVAYVAPPASQSELLLYELTSARDTLYLTTERSEDAIYDAFERSSCPTGEPEVRYIASDAPMQQVGRASQLLSGEANLIIDPVDLLERGERGQYRALLNQLQNHLINTGGIAVLHCLRSDDTPSLRTVTEHMADVVLDLRSRVNGTSIETHLAVPKFRGGRALSETIKLELADRVRVDTSRDIA